jgi:hypothetical protein
MFGRSPNDNQPWLGESAAAPGEGESATTPGVGGRPGRQGRKRADVGRIVLLVLLVVVARLQGGDRRCQMTSSSHSSSKLEVLLLNH